MVEEPTLITDWMEADEPFCFLALCEEYKAVFLDESRSRVYVFFGRDQTCSGVQILSAIIKDPKAAYYTNVVVTEAPQDLYGEVAKEAQQLMRNELWLKDQMERREAKRLKHNANAKPENQWEERWVVEVDPSVHDRATNKTQAMTTGYGATIQTRYGNIKKALLKKQKKGEIPNIHPGDINIVCKAGVDGMGEAFPAYMELNKWFKQFAKAALQAGVEQITWTTPTGMFVSQEYREPLYEQVKTYAAGGGHYGKLGLSHDGYSFIETGYGDVKLSKNQSAIAANFVHSLDASVMVFGILDTPEDVQMYTVHDCIYTLSGYFGQTIPNFRKGLHNVVTSPVLEELLESNGLTDVMELPPIGELDLDEIKESPYLFC
jgi:DNA-directed RNA polymerase